MHSAFSLFSRLFFHLRVRLLLLVILTCAPLIALTLHTSSEERRRQTADWEHQGRRLAQLAENEEAKLTSSTRQLLAAMAESGPIRSGQPKDCEVLLAQLFRADRRYANLGLLTTNGAIVAT